MFDKLIRTKKETCIQTTQIHVSRNSIIDKAYQQNFNSTQIRETTVNFFKAKILLNFKPI